MANGGLAAMRVDEFLQRLASGEPTPGGGSASALAGALGAALVGMVCNLTLGRERYAAFESEARALLDASDRLRARLQRGIDEDAAAYDAVMAAYRLPRATDQDKETRSAAIQAATVEAALVPLALAEASAQVIDLAERALGNTNPNAASDLAVAALLGAAALDGAAANVEINIASLKDEATTSTIAAQLAAARADRRKQVARVVAQTHG